MGSAGVGRAFSGPATILSFLNVEQYCPQEDATPVPNAQSRHVLASPSPAGPGAINTPSFTTTTAAAVNVFVGGFELFEHYLLTVLSWLLRCRWEGRENGRIHVRLVLELKGRKREEKKRKIKKRWP